MSLKFSIKSLHIINLREMEDVKIDFQKGNNFILMRNGYGKTTILEIIKSMYTGKLLCDNGEGIWGPNKEAKYGGSELDSYSDDDLSESSAELEMEIYNEQGGAETWKLWQRWDHESGENYFQTMIPGKGHEEGWKLPLNFSNKLKDNEAFADVFAFDAEEAVKMIRKQKGDEIRNAFREITSTTRLFDLIKENDGQIVKVFYKDLDKLNLSEVDTGAKNYSSWLHKVDKLILENEAWSKKLTSKKDENQRIHDEKKKKWDNLGSGDVEAKETEKELVKEEDELLNELKDKTIELLISLGNPGNLQVKQWKKTYEMHNVMFEAKIPEGVGKPFFQDLCNKHECVCGELMTDSMREYIRKTAENYLGRDELDLIKNMQREIRENKNPQEDIFELGESISQIKKDLKVNARKLRAIRKKFNPKIQQERGILEEEMRKLRDEIEKQNTKLEEIISTDPNKIRANNWDKGCIKDTGTLFSISKWGGKNNKNPVDNLYTLRRIQKTLKQKVSTTEELMHLETGGRVIQLILGIAAENVMEEVKKDTQRVMSESFHDVPIVEDYDIKLDDERGIIFINRRKEIQKKGSVGTTLVAAYSLINGMKQSGEVEIPLIVDSPTAGLDNTSTQGVVETFWNQSEQAIFIIESGERDKISLQVPDALSDEKSERILIRRKDEKSTGANQKGKMIKSYNSEEFFTYYTPKGKRE
jgi:hypothetical protein